MSTTSPTVTNAATQAVGCAPTDDSVELPATAAVDHDALSYSGTMSRGLLVPIRSLVEFEPQGLCSRSADFERIITGCAGLPPADITKILAREAGAVDADTRAARALRASLLILRDYVNAGFYPLTQNGRVALAPLLESKNFSAADRRSLIQAMYKQGRINTLSEPATRRSFMRTLEAARSLSYDAAAVVDALTQGAPRLHLIVPGPGRERMAWRAVRATWSMAPEASAPGREISIVLADSRQPDTPLGVAQFRNVVPEIRARDSWLGLVSRRADGSPGGYIDRLTQGDPRDRLRATARVLEKLLRSVNPIGLPDFNVGGGLSQSSAMQKIAKGRRDAFNASRRDGDSAAAHQHLVVTKRAETVAELSLGLAAISHTIGATDPVVALRADTELRRQLDAGLRKIWHYHMGFVALEMSICGAAPPFGPLRLGKLAASVAGSASISALWGDRPLGQIASTVYKPSVRDEIPNPGPLVVFTSGLYPGHSAQYTRATSGTNRWRHIGDTRGYGSFHVSPETVNAIDAFNKVNDGYVHISRTFGEGASARFRAIGKALGALGLPDVRKHDTQRPLYALPLVPDPGGLLLGWETFIPNPEPDLQKLADQWWTRWVEPKRFLLAERTRQEPDLLDELLSMGRRIDASTDLLSYFDKGTRANQLSMAEGWE